MTKPMIEGLVRHIFTIAGGALVSRGVIDAEIASQIVGVGVTITGIAWSFWDKRGV